MTSTGPGHVVVVGASLAGLRAASVLRAEGYDNDLTMIDPEPGMPYDRPPLSKKFLVGELDLPDIALRGVDLDANWMLGVQATGLDVDAREIETSTGDGVTYDALVIATGSRPRSLPAFPIDRSTVFELRTAGDAAALRNALVHQPRVAIVGGGFIGVEVASTCHSIGCEVGLISPGPLLEGLGELVSTTVERLCADGAVALYREAAVALSNARDGRGVRLASGELVPADIVVIAVGAVPEVSWLDTSRVPISDGVACDRYGFAVGHENILAAGDVARWADPVGGDDGVRVEHWTNAIEQGALVARNLLRGRHEGAAGSMTPSFWSDHFGRRLQAIGTPAAANRTEMVEGSLGEVKFGADLYLDETLVAAVGYGVPGFIAQRRRELSSKANRSAVRAGQPY